MSLGSFAWKIVDATFPGLSVAFKVGAGLGAGVGGATPDEAAQVAGASDDPITSGVVSGSAAVGGTTRKNVERSLDDTPDEPRRLSVMGFFGLSNDLSARERAWGLFRLALLAGAVGTPSYLAWRAASAAGRAAVTLAPAALDTGGRVGTAVLTNAGGTAQLVRAFR